MSASRQHNKRHRKDPLVQVWLPHDLSQKKMDEQVGDGQMDMKNKFMENKYIKKQEIR
jgi:hypothetical protein